ncbi:ankyrin [Atractiella rhizophila]|nr:ankyrin [Atractiella rhizophila]
MSSLPPETVEFAHKVFDLARSGDVTTLRTYLEAGLPANLTNAAGDTLVMLSAYRGHPSLLQVLLEEFKADPNRLNEKNQSPLAGAIFKGEKECVRILARNGADWDAGTPSAREAVGVFNATWINEEGLLPPKK